MDLGGALIAATGATQWVGAGRDEGSGCSSDHSITDADHRTQTTARHWPSGTSFSRLCPHPARRLHLTRDLCRSYYHLYRQSTLLSGKLTHCTAAGPDTRYTVVSITCCLQSIEMSCTGFLPSLKHQEMVSDIPLPPCYLFLFQYYSHGSLIAFHTRFHIAHWSDILYTLYRDINI